MHKPYQLIDSGNQLKLEKFGEYSIIRPCSQALWRPLLPAKVWDQADAVFSRQNTNGWTFRKKLPNSWEVNIAGVDFKVSPTDFGHLGVFPEHSFFWKEMQDLIKRQSFVPKVLNLFAYSGGASIAAGQAGAQVCHLDASKPMVAWARENAALNDLEKAPIRWIVDDVFKFLKREIKRDVRYEGIILDPPSFGRGNKGEVFKIEDAIHELLELCSSLLSEHPLFLLFTTHTPGMTPLVMDHLLKQGLHQKKGSVQTGEMRLENKTGFDIPSGSYAKWIRE